MPTNLSQARRRRGPALDLQGRILKRMRHDSAPQVWTPNDFVDLGSRAGIGKALQRLVASGGIRRIDRGLYDTPRINQLTNKLASPDYTAVIDAVARRDNTRLLVDGLTAANQLGLTTAVPGRVIVHTDARLRPIQLDQLKIVFKLTAPSRLYWAGRPGMRIVQALHWFRDMPLADRNVLLNHVRKIVWDPAHGPEIRDDLRKGMDALPQWMRETMEMLLSSPDRRGTRSGRRTTHP